MSKRVSWQSNIVTGGSFHAKVSGKKSIILLNGRDDHVKCRESDKADKEYPHEEIHTCLTYCDHKKLPQFLDANIKYALYLDNSKYKEEISSIAVIMLYGNSFTNPIIYNACNEEFRKSFRSYFRLLIRPCAILVHRKQEWDNRAEIQEDLATTYQRTRSFRRPSSRKESFNTRTNGAIPTTVCRNNRTNRISYYGVNSLLQPHQTCTDRNSHRNSVPLRKASLIQYASAL